MENQISKKETIREKIPDTELFSKIIAMFQIAAIDQMGLLKNPVTGKRRKPNIQLAGESIAMLEFLQKRMNNSDEEDTVLENVLDDLRLRYYALIDLITSSDE